MKLVESEGAKYKVIDVDILIFFTVWLGIGFGLPLAMIGLYYLQKIFKIKSKS